jgi:AcrR family transcriptional regulator
MPEIVESRRDRKRNRTRLELVGSARSLIAEHGVAALRVSDVTERSDVALGSFYSHFETKDEIVEAVVSEAVTALADAIGDMGDHLADPAEAMSIGARRLIELCRTDPELARVLIKLPDAEARFRELLWPRAFRIMQRGAGSSRFRIHDPSLMLSIAIAGVLATIRAIVEQRAGPDAAGECAAGLLQMVGVAHDEAVEISRRELPALPRQPSRRASSGRDDAPAPGLADD